LAKAGLKKPVSDGAILLVRPDRFELPTFWFVNQTDFRKPLNYTATNACRYPVYRV